MELDNMGRTTQVLGPEHSVDLSGATPIRTASWTVYNEIAQETWNGQGYQTVSGGAYTLIDPVSISRHDDDGRTTDSIVSKRTSGSGRLMPAIPSPRPTGAAGARRFTTTTAT